MMNGMTVQILTLECHSAAFPIMTDKITQLFQIMTEKITQLFEIMTEKITQWFPNMTEKITQLFPIMTEKITQYIQIMTEQIFSNNFWKITPGYVFLREGANWPNSDEKFPAL